MPAPKFLPAILLGACLAVAPAKFAGAESAGSLTFSKPRPAASVSGSGLVAPFQLAQAAASTAQVNQLQEQVRILNGRIEELTFQLLQMQEELRRMQEDNEIRFQQLESSRGIDSSQNRVARNSEQPKADSRAETGGENAGGGNNDTIAGLLGRDGGESAESGDTDEGLQPRTLGTLTFDEQGNVVGSAADEPIDLTGRRSSNSGSISEVTPGAPSRSGGAFPDNPNELYDLGYEYIQAGDYEQAELAFGEFAARYPDSERVAEARFWLGESLFAQGEYEEAARIFLDTHKQYPQGRMAPQTLLKLGVSLAGMEQREIACATFAEVSKKYPEMPNAVRTTLASEQRAANCMVN